MTDHLRHHRISFHYDYETGNRSITCGDKSTIVTEEMCRKIECMAHRDGNEIMSHDDFVTSERLYAITKKQYALFLLMLK